jgi:hypothetical protein
MEPDIVITISASKVNCFHFLLQQGVRLQTTIGESVRDFLLHRLELAPGEIEEKVQTVFLNGKAVDDLDQAILTDQAYLALSGALPGLVGATMRRGGFYSSFRNPIKYQDEKSGGSRHEGVIGLKLFNILLGDLAPRVLAQGFLIEYAKLLDFLKRNETELWEDCLIRRKGERERACREGLPGSNDPGQLVYLQVITRG